jgi:electron transfer flavoprotein beta subunit
VALEVFVAMQATVSIQGRARIARDGRSVAAECLQSAPNPGDLVALEEALRLRDTGQVSKVSCIAAGATAADAVLSHGLAMGADRTVRIPTTDDLYVDTQRLGRSIAAAVAGSAGKLVFAASTSPDGEADALPHVIAAALHGACLTNVMSLRLSPNEVEVVRWLEQGRREIWGAHLPAIVAFEGRANTPRYAAVAALILARRTVSAGSAGSAAGTDIQATAHDPATMLRKLLPPRIRPKRMAGGPIGQPASERMRAAIGGGTAEMKRNAVLSGPPDRVANRIVAFLDARGLLGTERR